LILITVVFQNLGFLEVNFLSDYFITGYYQLPIVFLIRENILLVKIWKEEKVLF
jgi:hypothetical protein